MRRIEMTISISRKVNLGNYESFDVFVAEKVAMEGDEQPETIAPTILAELREVLGRALKERDVA